MADRVTRRNRDEESGYGEGLEPWREGLVDPGDRSGVSLGETREDGQRLGALLRIHVLECDVQKLRILLELLEHQLLTEEVRFEPFEIATLFGGIETPEQLQRRRDEPRVADHLARQIQGCLTVRTASEERRRGDHPGEGLA